MEHSHTTVRELKAQLSAYLRRVEAGEIVTITRHGKAIGRIVPVAESVEARLEELARAGLIAWNGERLPLSAPTAHAEGGQSVAALLLENRE